MELDHRDFIDSVVFDLIYFLSKYRDSEKDIENWYSDVDYRYHTDLEALFDQEQMIGFSYLEGVVIFVLLDNNKLLKMDYREAMPGEKIEFFYFALLSLGDSYTLEIKDDEKKGKMVILESTVEGRKPIVFHEVTYSKSNGKISLSEILKPVSYEQMFKRGKVSKTKKKKR